MTQTERHVQAYISNISFPKTLDGVDFYCNERGLYDTELIEDAAAQQYEVEWTAPKWAMPGDIVFFFHAKTAIQTIRRLEIAVQRDRTMDFVVSANLLKGLQRGRTLYERYGGKVFAVGFVADHPFYDGDAVYEKQHWKSRVYVRIGGLQMLQSPVPIEAFKDFLLISRQSSITPVLGEDFGRLKELVCGQNEVPNELKNAIATPFPLRDIHEGNWLPLTAAYHRAFQLESAFRTFYVNYFLQAIADKRTLYRECECRIKGHLSGYVDNCIWLSGKLCFVEVKLNWDAERNLEEQLERYCNVDEVWLSRELKMPMEKWIGGFVLVIDRERIGVYDHRIRQVLRVAELEYVHAQKDLMRVRTRIIRLLGLDA